MKTFTMSNTPSEPGYKCTEVGVFPEDWEVYQLGDIVDFLDGRRRPIKDADRAKMRGDIPYYGASGIIDYVNDYIFDDELILLGEDGENILSRNARLAFRVSGRIWVNNHAHVLKPKPGFEIGYLTEFLESLDYSQYNTGTAQPKLNMKTCRVIRVAAPALFEQRAISEALSDVDALLDALDRLIAKKRAIKQGAMQALLTGRVRLPGFSGKWQTKRIGVLLDYERPEKYIVRSTDYVAVGTPVLTANKSFVLGYTDEEFGIYTDLPVIIFDDFTTDTKYADFPFKVKSSAIKLLKPKDGRTNLNYMFERMKLIDFSLGDHKRYYISEYRHIEISVPDLKEQGAIAEVLSDMDAEIDTLEKRRTKLRDIKQGMMQELLTGRIRLVQPQEKTQEAHV